MKKNIRVGGWRGGVGVGESISVKRQERDDTLYTCNH